MALGKQQFVTDQDNNLVAFKGRLWGTVEMNMKDVANQSIQYFIHPAGVMTMFLKETCPFSLPWSMIGPG